jgi:hypothetical protein
MKRIQRIAVLALLMVFLSGCALIRSGSQIAEEATPTINALLEAGKRNDLEAGLNTYATETRNAEALKTLFASRRDVFDAFTPIRAKDSSYSAVIGRDLFGDAALVEARIPGVPGVSLKAEVLKRGNWQIKQLEFFKTP